LARRRRPVAFLLVLLAAGGTAACAARARPIVADRPVTLNGHALQLHFANAASSLITEASPPLLVFATGDGGMHRKDLDAYRHLVALGYPIVAFDARDYVTHLGHDAATTPARLAADYQRIIDAARQTLNLTPVYPVVLVWV
jgi:type IV secretory pathway VirJ component